MTIARVRSRRHVAAVALAACALLLAITRVPAKAATSGVLEFSDNFPGPTIDVTKWTPDTGTSSHSHEIRLSTQDLAKNGLQIVANEVPGTTRIVSGSVTSIQQFLYGRFDVIATLPKGRGFIPDIWLKAFNSQGQMSGEIDMVEAFGSDTTRFQTTLHHWKNGVDMGEDCIQIGWVGAKGDICTNWVPHINFGAGYHDFGMIWTPKLITFLVDGHAYWSDSRNVPSVPMAIEIGLGQEGQWDGWPDATTRFPTSFDIKSVTVRSL